VVHTPEGSDVRAITGAEREEFIEEVEEGLLA
jgi:hypothetical protein